MRGGEEGKEGKRKRKRGRERESKGWRERYKCRNIVKT